MKATLTQYVSLLTILRKPLEAKHLLELPREGDRDAQVGQQQRGVDDERLEGRPAQRNALFHQQLLDTPQVRRQARQKLQHLCAGRKECWFSAEIRS